MKAMVSARLAIVLIGLWALASPASVLAQPTSRIWGGEETQKLDFPYVASVRLDGGHICGGSIIGQKFILTAAHCVHENNKVVAPKRLAVRVGSTNQFSGGKLVDVASVTVNPDYSDVKNNLAILTLENALEWTERVRAITLPTASDSLPADGTNLLVAGWGQQLNSDSAFKLNSYRFTVATEEVCKNAYSALDSSEFCLAHPLKEGSCYGDAGNGAVYNNKLYGVSNFVVGACGSRFPDVFTNVVHYLSWIESVDIYFGGSWCCCEMSVLNYLLVLSAVLCAACATPMGGRVVGGHDAVPKQFPYQISLRRDHSHTCGGSIIDKKWILTAAHCVVIEGITPYPAERFTVRAGTINRIAGGIIINVKKVIVHPGYEVYNDLALLELEEELEYSETIQPVELADEEVPAGEEVVISGWGLTEHAGANLPIILQWYTVSALSKTGCASKIGLFTDALICLAHPSGAGACNGDSGGPAVYDGKLVGVAGFVVIKCGSTRPDGYAKVAYNIEWIRENMA
ncbi:transmembrane protease serine 2-like [Musca vetustissima]|uniref:transmembrane protease serine 2-like n=1 Tax=Musca vetustissima TaxID=27455 RepID=UPI002AB64700|nr:transmembrane protease serine 2-like [Musca vetustissima]